MEARTADQVEPENYYVDWDGQTGKEVRLETGYPAGTAVITRRAKWITKFEGLDRELEPEESVHGYQQIQASPDVIAVRAAEFEYQMDWIYQQWVHAEVWNETFQYWERPQPIAKFSTVLYEPILDNQGNIQGYTDRVIGIEFTADFGLGNVLKTIINYNWFTGDQNKHTYSFYWPGVKKRIYTQLQIYNSSRFQYHLADFDGPYEVIEQAGLTNIIYYPDGVIEDECIVDPYLGVNEQANYYDIQADSALIRLWFNRSDNSSDAIEFFVTGAERWKSRSWNQWNFNSNEYGIHHSTSTQKIEIVENGPLRIKIRHDTNYVESPGDGGNVCANSIHVINHYSIYQNRIVIDYEWEIGPAVLSAPGYFSYSCVFGFHWNTVFNVFQMWEDTGVEVRTGSFAAEHLDGALWAGVQSEFFNGQIIPVWATSTQFKEMTRSGEQQRGVQFYPRPTNAFPSNIDVGVHRAMYIMELDSYDRETDIAPTTWDVWAIGNAYLEHEITRHDTGWKRYLCIVPHTAAASNEPGVGVDWQTYWVEYRIELGLQHTDNDISVNPDVGQWVTNLTGYPLSIGTGGYASDGAWHIQP